VTDDQEREVVIVDYDRRWPALFQAERQRLLLSAADAIIEVDHVGSTSVPGLAAKPIVDILVVLRRFLNDAEIAAVCAPGHEYRGIDADIGRQYFSKRGAPAYHIHGYAAGNPELLPMLRFRDHLRSNPAAARDYEALKRDLAQRYRFERYAYRDGKTDFVLAALARVGGSD